MIRIGDFSKLSRISIRMLRHYNELGLLVPEQVDPSTGYRYYSAAQLAVANQIQVFKSMGFGLSTIGEILNQLDDAESLRSYLLIHQAHMKEEEAALHTKLQLLERAITRLGEDKSMMKYDVVVKEIPARTVASLREIIAAYDQEGMLWNRMMEETANLSLKIGNPGYSLAIFHDEGYKESDVDVEIQFVVVGEYADTERVRFKTVDPVTVCSATMTGEFSQLTEVNNEIASWIQANNYIFAGPMFNIYHVGPGQESDSSKWITEVCYPVQKK